MYRIIIVYCLMVPLFVNAYPALNIQGTNSGKSLVLTFEQAKYFVTLRKELNRSNLEQIISLYFLLGKLKVDNNLSDILIVPKQSEYNVFYPPEVLELIKQRVRGAIVYPFFSLKPRKPFFNTLDEFKKYFHSSLSSA